MWSSEEALKSSTYRELKAVLLALFSLQEVFQNRLVAKLLASVQTILSGNTFLAKNRFCGKDWQLFNQN
jgi:hypothetical protein